MHSRMHALDRQNGEHFGEYRRFVVRQEACEYIILVEFVNAVQESEETMGHCCLKLSLPEASNEPLDNFGSRGL